ncbi:MAG: ATP synthase F0 subunit B [Acidobacteria bacterium]|nr:ATP synthase F0 subunit B [Acidobacteriota bacterium]
MKMFARIALIFVLIFGVAGVRAQEAPAPASPSAESGHQGEPEANSAQKRREAEEGSEAFKKSPSVIALGKMVGLSPEASSTAFTWFNFFLLAAAILYALGKMLPKAFRGRTEGIQKGLVEARTATEEANARLGGVEARLARLDQEIAALRTQSEKDAAADEARIKASLAEERQRILEAAEQEIASAQSHAERSLREYAAKLAVERAAAELHISSDQDSALVREFAARLSAKESN